MADQSVAALYKIKSYIVLIIRLKKFSCKNIFF